MTFGFSVRHPWGWNEDEEYVERTDLWIVSLPHQCDAWQITGEGWEEGVKHDRAVLELEQFVAEAQSALARLKTRLADHTDDTGA